MTWRDALVAAVFPPGAVVWVTPMAAAKLDAGRCPACFWSQVVDRPDQQTVSTGLRQDGPHKYRPGGSASGLPTLGTPA